MASNDIVHVIDDDTDVRQSLAFLLSTAGLAVRVHESGSAFLKILSEVQEGCIVTDVRMAFCDPDQAPSAIFLRDPRRKNRKYPSPMIRRLASVTRRSPRWSASYCESSTF